MTEQKTVLIHSNANWVGTGYGGQVRTFVPLLHAAGWKIIVSAFYGLQGAPLHTQYGTVLPVGLDAWGNDVLPMHYRRFKPDVMFHLHDIWVMETATLQQYPASSWCPVDHKPLPPNVKRGLDACRWQIAMSRFGEREMRAAGFDPLYIPHGVDTEIFRPIERQKAREAWGVSEDTFLAVVVAANKGNPSRKSLDRILKAWALFDQAHPTLDKMLYLHTLPISAHGGWDILAIAKQYGVHDDIIRVPDTYRFVMGEYTWEALANLYSAADVKLDTSMGEGFGITTVESQACGCPVIVTDFSAQTELCFGGYKVPVDPVDDMTWTYQDSEQAFVKVSEIVKGIEWALDNRGNQAIREQARAGALDYDAKRVFERYMHPVFNFMADVNKELQQVVEPPKTAQEAA